MRQDSRQSSRGAGQPVLPGSRSLADAASALTERLDAIMRSPRFPGNLRPCADLGRAYRALSQTRLAQKKRPIGDQTWAGSTATSYGCEMTEPVPDGPQALWGGTGGRCAEQLAMSRGAHFSSNPSRAASTTCTPFHHEGRRPRWRRARRRSRWCSRLPSSPCRRAPRDDETVGTAVRSVCFYTTAAVSMVKRSMSPRASLA